MALIIFQYALPILLGYTFFVGIAGRYLPLPRPQELSQRPAWFLGLWSGIAIAAIMIYGLRIAYQMDLNQLSALFAPGAKLIATALLPGLVGYLWYRSRVKQQSAMSLHSATHTKAEDAPHAVSEPSPEPCSDNGVDNTLAVGTSTENELDDTVPVDESFVIDIDDHSSQWAQRLDDAELACAALDETLLFDIEPINTGEPLLNPDTDFNVTVEAQASIIPPAEHTQASAKTNPLAAEALTEAQSGAPAIEAPNSAQPSALADEAPNSAQPGALADEAPSSAQSSALADEALASPDRQGHTNDHCDTTTSDPIDAMVENTDHTTQANLLSTTATGQSTDAMLAHNETLESVRAERAASASEANRLRDELNAEVALREELEAHLRATRHGLSALESESREFKADKASALMELEKVLEEKVKRASAAEARADREANKRAELETSMVQLREDALRATNESRVSVEARAQALSTANKATTFARQAMQIRSRLEIQLHEAETELVNKQSTISSLIKALEKEKSRTQEDVASMAKQLRLHEKQLQARRTLEEVSRSVDNKLSNRLVKKVARARG